MVKEGIISLHSRKYPGYAYVFLKDTTIVLLASITTNFFNFLLQLATARLLSIENYGTFQTIMNLINILTIFTVIIRLQFTKELTKLINYQQLGEAKNLVKLSKLTIVLIGIPLALFLFYLNTIFFHRFQFLDTTFTLIIISLSILTFLIAINRAILRSSLQFLKMSINGTLQSILRVVIISPLLLLGTKLEGALVGSLLAYIITYAHSFWQNKDFFRNKSSKSHGINLSIFAKESVLTMIGFLGLTSLISVDLILVKSFIPSQAGYYAGLTLFGKVIIFATTPISLVLFPSLINKQKNGQKRSLFILAICATILISLVIFGTLILIPKQIILLTLSPSYLAIVPNLPAYSLFILVYSISYLIVNGFIAINEFFPSYLALAAGVAQILGIFLFHRNILEVVQVSLVTCLALGLILLVFSAIKFKSMKINENTGDEFQKELLIAEEVNVG